jgi:hypothetical protein
VVLFFSLCLVISPRHGVTDHYYSDLSEQQLADNQFKFNDQKSDELLVYLKISRNKPTDLPLVIGEASIRPTLFATLE